MPIVLNRVHLRPVPRLGAMMLVVFSTLAGGTACDGGPSKPPAPDEPSELFWSVELDQHAALLSSTSPLYDTLTVVATARNYQGDPLAGLPAPQFRSSDPTVVSVSPSGGLTALRPGTVSIVASVMSNNLKHADTIQVVAVDDPAPVALGNLSIRPIMPDSAKVGLGVVLKLEKFLRLTDAAGQPYPWQAQAPVAMRIADAAVAGWSEYGNHAFRLMGNKVGRTDVSASTVVFGVARADTVSVRVGLPLNSTIDIGPISEGSQQYFSVQPELIVGTGAWVTFNLLPGARGTAEEIVFDDATNVGPFSAIRWQDDFIPLALAYVCPFSFPYLDCGAAGNVTFQPAYSNLVQYAYRTFNVPGIYRYHSTLHGTAGAIIVQDDSTESP